jgi:DNA-binding CsgD family transcriptional regulator
MRLDSGPITVRIEAEGPAGEELLARAEEFGLVLAAPGQEGELVALPDRGPARESPRQGDKPLLSPRELEIVDYLVDGWSNAEIASVLGIGVRTVRFHLEGVFGKLGVSRRGEAVHEAIRLGLVRFDA